MRRSFPPGAISALFANVFGVLIIAERYETGMPEMVGNGVALHAFVE